MSQPVKYAIILTDGAADFPLERMGGRTPLMAALTPNFDRLAAEGRSGMLETVPPGMPAGSAIANLSILGYDPAECYQGRGVLEAASIGVDIGPSDVALRCNLIHVADGRIVDHSSGHLPTPDGTALITAVGEALGSQSVEFHPGISYRHLLVLRGERFSAEVRCFPPHDHIGKTVEEVSPRPKNGPARPTAELLVQLVRESARVLADHPVNHSRRDAGLRTADLIWPWSPGRRPSMATLEQRFGLRGAVISAVDLIHGMGAYAGMTSIPVGGVTGLYDTNYEGKMRGALDALESHDLVYIHIEGPDEAGHARDLGLKIHAIESIDRRVAGPLVAGMEARGWNAVVAVLPDHLTPVERGDHVGNPVPFLIRDPDIEPDAVTRFDEEAAQSGSLGLLPGPAFLRKLLWRQRH